MCTTLARAIARMSGRTRSVRVPPSEAAGSAAASRAKIPTQAPGGGRWPPLAAHPPAGRNTRRRRCRQASAGRGLGARRRKPQSYRRAAPTAVGWIAPAGRASDGGRPRRRLYTGRGARRWAAADAGLVAQPGHRRLPPFGLVEERRPQACQTIGLRLADHQRRSWRFAMSSSGAASVRTINYVPCSCTRCRR